MRDKLKRKGLPHWSFSDCFAKADDGDDLNPSNVWAIKVKVPNWVSNHLLGE